MALPLISYFRSRDRERDRERRRSKSRDRDRDRDSRKSRRSRSRSRDRKHRDRSRDNDRRRRSPSHQSQVQLQSPPQQQQLHLADIGAANFAQPRNNFMNLFGNTTDLALMEQELALNPHLLQRMAQDTDLAAQLMKFNSELAGLGSNSNGSLMGGVGSDKQTPTMNIATPFSYDASNSCDNSQDGNHSRFFVFQLNCDN